MASHNEGQVLLDDPLEAFANDEVHVDVDDVDPSSNNMMGISSSSISTPVPGVDDDIKPPYPEDTVDDEGHLVDEHDDDNDDDHDALDIDDEEDLRKDLSINSKPANIAAKKAPSSPKHRKKRDVTVMRKAPQAPKRFKSSYICFFTSKQSEIKEILGDKATVMEISKKSAQMWKELGAEERSHWEDVAAKDKERYMIEKATYSGPWQVPYKRTKKDPSAPKRPMSAFLLFSQGRRGNIKEDNPGMKNTEISRLLGEQWRNCTDAERLPFVEEEKELREKYKIALSEWKEKEGERKEEEMKRRKEQLEWQKRQHQLAMEKAQHYAQQHNNVHLPMDPFTHPMYAMHPPPPSQGYPGYQPQGYPVQYAVYPPQAYQYPAAGKQQPAILGPNGVPHYNSQHPPQHYHHQQQSPLPASHTQSAQMYYQQPAPTPTNAFEIGHGPGPIPDSEYPDFDQLAREPQTAE